MFAARAEYGGTATLLLTVAVADPPAFAAVLDNTNPAVIIGHSGLVAQVNSSGGDGAYTYALQPADGNLTVGADGRISLLTGADNADNADGGGNGG